MLENSKTNPVAYFGLPVNDMERTGAFDTALSGFAIGGYMWEDKQSSSVSKVRKQI